jgi:hypothetical protein
VSHLSLGLLTMILFRQSIGGAGFIGAPVATLHVATPLHVQAALMAQGDSRSPAVIVTLSALFNLVADVLFIAVYGWGLAGAAIATVLTQYLSFGALLWVCYQPGRLRPAWPQETPDDASRSPVGTRSGAGGSDGQISDSDFQERIRPADGKLLPRAAAGGDGATSSIGSGGVMPGGSNTIPLANHHRDIVANPPAAGVSMESAEAQAEAESDADVGGSAQRGGMLATVYAAKLLCYFVVQGAAMRLDVVELAAHNAMFSLWNVCAYFPVPLQTTALSFVPRCTTPAVRRLLLPLGNYHVLGGWYVHDVNKLVHLGGLAWTSHLSRGP